MNRVLITGWALQGESGECALGNVDMGWLHRNPLTLIWADKICITHDMWDIITSKRTIAPTAEISECYKVILELADDFGIIEKIEPSEVISSPLMELMSRQISADAESMNSQTPHTFQIEGYAKDGSRTFLRVGGVRYCSVHIYAIYRSLVLAKFFNASCLFDSPALNYIQHKYRALNPSKVDARRHISCFAKAFDTLLPNEPAIPPIAFARGVVPCRDCNKELECRSNYPTMVEKQARRILSWRDYDEIQRAKEALDAIVRCRHNSSADEVISEFRSKQARLNRRIRSAFPRIQRWAHLSTLISIPMCVGGMTGGPSLLTVPGAAIAGMSQMAHHLVEFLKSRYRWIAFIQSRTEDGSLEKLP